jgi:hypothetical protein
MSLFECLLARLFGRKQLLCELSHQENQRRIHAGPYRLFRIEKSSSLDSSATRECGRELPVSGMQIPPMQCPGVGVSRPSTAAVTVRMRSQRPISQKLAKCVSHPVRTDSLQAAAQADSAPRKCRRFASSSQRGPIKRS